MLQSEMLIVDACKSFNDHCISGIEPNLEQIEENLTNSLMLVTALNPISGMKMQQKLLKKLMPII